MDEEAVDDFKIAVSEACANAVLSQEAQGVKAPIEVGWSDDDGRVVVEVGDRGLVYDPDSVDSSDTQRLRLAMSVALLRSLVDECRFAPRAGGGMCTRLVVDV